jgi:transposase
MKPTLEQLEQARERQRAMKAFLEAKRAGHANREAARRAGHSFMTIYRWIQKYKRADLSLECYLNKPHLEVRTAKKKREAKVGLEAAREAVEAAGARRRLAEDELQFTLLNLQKAKRLYCKMMHS